MTSPATDKRRLWLLARPHRQQGYHHRKKETIVIAVGKESHRSFWIGLGIVSQAAFGPAAKLRETEDDRSNPNAQEHRKQGPRGLPPNVWHGQERRQRSAEPQQ